MTKGRLEGFTDGVIALIITIMGLQLLPCAAESKVGPQHVLVLKLRTPPWATADQLSHLGR
jgi:uncharacterized membrane protein